jgi:hypothetical protein
LRYLALLRVEIFEAYFVRKAAQDWRNRWVMVPGIGSALGAFCVLKVIEEIKNPCDCRGCVQ